MDPLNLKRWGLQYRITQWYYTISCSYFSNSTDPWANLTTQSRSVIQNRSPEEGKSLRMSSSYLYHVKKCTTCTSFSTDSRMQDSKSMLKNPLSVEMNSNILDIGSPERESNWYLRKWRRSTTLLRQRIHENYTDSSVSSTTIVTHTISLSHMALLQDGTTCPYCELKIFIWQYKKKTKNG
jgi:hypothetical protein